MSRTGLTELLARLRASDVKLALDGERLKCDAPKGLLTPALQRELAEHKEQLIALLRTARSHTPPIPPLIPRLPGSDVPLSYAQEGAWFLDQLQPGVAFNIFWPMHLAGRLDEACLAQALDEIVRRHAVLRTTLENVDGRPRQVIHPPRGMPLSVLDLSELPAADREAEALRLVLELARRPFDLSRGPLATMTVFRLGEGDHLLLFTVHHSAFDGWSVKVFAQEFSAAYRALVSGQPPRLAPLAVEYADYAVWQRELLTGEFYAEQVRYWRTQLADCPVGLSLVTDRRSSTRQLFEGAVASRPLSTELIRSLRALAQREGLTLFMVLGAAFKTLLMRYTGVEDIVAGTPIANRSQPQMAGVIGFCVNLLALRTSLAGNPTFRELAARERRTCLGAFDHQELPFGRLVQELDPVRGIDHSPFFQVQFALHEAQNYALDLPGLRSVSHWESGQATDDVMGLLARAQPATDYLFLNIVDSGSEAGAWMHYRADLFSAESVRRMLAHLERLLEAIVRDPERPIWDLPLLAADEHRLLVENLCRGQAVASQILPADRSLWQHACVHQLVEAQAERTPDALAVVLAAPQNLADESDSDQSLTYGELNRRANQLAHLLISRGVGPESRVAILLDRTPRALVALLGVLKAGGAFVPLDASYPRERLALLFDDAMPSVVVTLEQFASDVPLPRTQIVCLDGDAPALGQQSIQNPTSGVRPENAAYVIYTSGSTGRPKGVVVPHRSVVNHNLAAASRFGLTASDRVLQFHSISFDAAIEEIFPSWLSGATLVMRGADLILPGAELHHFIQRYGLTVLNLPTAYWHQWMDHAQRDNEAPSEPLRLVIVGGDQVSPERYAAWQSLAGERIRWLNTYGPTETTVISTCDEPAEYAVEDGAEVPITIGRPIDHTQAYILDPRLQLTPIGVPGELYLGGRGVARGYHKRSGLTAQRFVPNPLAELPGARLYRTGDRARFRPDGRIEFLGRIDQQLKIRGFRVEPGEIAAALREHPSAREALVVGHGEAGDKRLVAYVARVAGAEVSPDELRTFLEGKLPAYMVPSALVILDDFPLTAGGKIDRRALPDPANLHSQAGREYVAPRTLVELELARIWSDTLGVPRVGVYDNFFALGGNSLKATEIVYRLRKAIGVELPLRNVFEHPTLAGLARAVDTARGNAAALLPPVEPAPRDGPIPLSYAQEGAWLVDQLQPGVPFNIPLPLHLKGAIELPSLERALSRVVARHESLRTSFASADGQPYQVIAGDARTPLELVDLRYLDADERRRELVGRLIDAAGQPFDLGQSPLIRLIVYQIADDEHVFFFVAHHIVFDGHSVGVFARDLTALYAAEVSGAEPGLPELSIQYADYAAWQRRVLSGDFLEAELGYWRQQLADYPTGLNLPTRRRAASDELYRGDTVAALLSEEQSAALRALAQREGVTLFMLLLAAFKALLTRYSGQEDIIVGTPVANRNQPEMADVIGFCVNMLALRTNLAGNPTFRELLSREREVCLAAYTHQEVPLGLLVQHLRPDRHISHSPFFSIGFVLQPAPPQTEAVDGFALAPAADEDAQALLAELDRRRGDVTPATDLLFLQTADTGRQIAAVMQHSSAAFSSATIERMLGHYERLLAAIVDDPGCPIWDLPLLAADERSLLVENFSRGQVFVPPDGQTGRLRREDVCLHQLVEAQAERTPDATAVVLAVPPDSADEADCNQSLTYDELNRRANQLAHQLISLGVGPESRVAVLLDRTPSALIALLGVLKAGGAFVPLDANYPRERMALLFGDARPPVVVTLEKFAQDVPLDRSRIVCLDGDAPALSQQSIDNPASGVQPDNAAYVIYTSGSTGRPKGVVVPHRSVVNHNLAAASRFGLTSSDRVLQFHSISFDAAIEEIFPTWLCGATLMMRGADLILPGAELHHFIRRYGVTVLDLPTAYWHQWVDQAQQDQDVPGEPLRLVIVGGDEVSPERYTAWQTLAGERIRWLNTYGPTETTIISTCDEPTAGPIEADADWSTTIGRPIDHTQAYVLDPRLEPTPIGVPGELYLGGRGVARGYHERPALTAERFVPDPLGDVPGARLYRTGDRARYRPDGRIEFLGRIDQQLKIRGFRVEPGEIVAALREHPGVREALVVGHGEAGDKRLVAYVAKCGGDVSPDDLRAFLEGKLPGYMVPSAFIILDDFPLTPGGKIDRRALPDPSGLSSELSVEYVAPQTATEIELARIWRGVLEVERVGTRDNFFALGGHSLLAAKLVARVRREMAIDLPLRALFEHPTVAGLAQAIDQGLIARLAGDADLDLAREATLADDIAPAGIATRSSDEPRAILLTGATGFLGAYLLHELLARTSADIYCLVRADDEAQARERLQTALARFDLGDESAAPRIVPVLGDLAETRLGLTDERFQALAESIDVVYHNGAWVNFIYPYAMLKQANVGGTEEVLRLACRAKLKPVHYVSTLSVFPGNRWAEGSVVESFRVDLGSGVRGGYAQSKWVAERLVALAAERGVPVTIHRPGRVTGDSRTGATYETAGLENLNSLLSLGVIPRVDWPTTLDIVPVDYVARAIVELASRPGSLGQAFHLNNPHPGSWPDLVAAFRRAGYQLREIEPRKWAAQVYQFIRATPTHALHEALPFVPPEISEMLDRWGQDGNAQAEESLLAPDAGAAEQRPPATADCRNVVALLAGTPFECPPAADLLDVYIGYFLRLGVLAPPEACSAIDDSRLSDRPSMAECPSP